MNNLKTHDAVFEAVCRDVFWAVDVVMWWTGDWGVEVIVKEAVDRAVRRTVSGTVSSASWFGPEYPALEDFLRAVGGVR